MLTKETKRRLRPLAIAALLTAVCFTAAIAYRADALADTANKPNLVKAGTIEIDQTQVALLISGNAGGGTFHYQGKPHAFSIGGLGIGGIGVSKIKATGTVYNLANLRDFEGTYGQARWGFTAGDKGKGDLWLEKTDGDVVIHLASQSKGLALSLGADLINIKFK